MHETPAETPAAHGPDGTLARDLLPGFRGDLAWVHAREGHGLDVHGRSAYWPGGASGVTLDPGCDLGYIAPDLFARAYIGILTGPQFAACRGALGFRGSAARRRLHRDGDLLSIRISRRTASGLFPVVAGPYWKDARRRWPSVADVDVPPAIHTVVLSIVYNRGAWNPGLAGLARPIESRDWEAFAEAVDAMQNDHRLQGITDRRDLEAQYVLENAAALADAGGGHVDPLPEPEPPIVRYRRAIELLREAGLTTMTPAPLDEAQFDVDPDRFTDLSDTP